MLRRRRKRCLIDICQVGAVFQEQLRDKIHVLSHHAARGGRTRTQTQIMKTGPNTFCRLRDDSLLRKTWQSELQRFRRQQMDGCAA